MIFDGSSIGDNRACILSGIGFCFEGCIIDKCQIVGIGEKNTACLLLCNHLCSSQDLLGIVARTSVSLWRRSPVSFSLAIPNGAISSSVHARFRIKIFVKFVSIVISVARI